MITHYSLITGFTHFEIFVLTEWPVMGVCNEDANRENKKELVTPQRRFTWYCFFDWY